MPHAATTAPKGGGASGFSPIAKGPKVQTELTLLATTAREIIERLPEVSVFTYTDNGRPQEIEVTFMGFEAKDARNLAIERGFAVA
jgi:hypothetical protein